MPAIGWTAIATAKLAIRIVARYEFLRSAGFGSLFQARESDLLELLDPVLDRAGTLPEKFGHLIGAKAVEDEQNPVKSVVIACFFGSCDFLLDGNSHDLSILNLEFAHTVPPFL